MMRLLNNLKIMLASLVLITTGACEDELEKATISENITASLLSEPSASTHVLTFEHGRDTFETFEWTATDFGFEANVTYTLQMDTAGGNFSGPVNLVSTQSLSALPSVSEVNAALLGKGAEPEVPAEVEFRIRATVNPNVDPVYSNEVTATITPYLVSFPPIFVIGDAQNWDLGGALELTSTGPGVYEAVGLFEEFGKFRFFATPSWDAEQWGWSYFEDGTIPDEFGNGADNDSNFLFEGQTGVYRVVVNLNTKTITLEEGEMPTLFVIGDAQDWDLASAAELTFLGGGRFEGTVDFEKDGYFRFFEKADWNATQYGYSYFSGGTIPEEFTDGGDGDSNFIFAGTSGSYDISVSLNNKTIEIVPASAYPASLFIVGDDQSWAFTEELSATGEGLYQGSASFTNGSTFRFFEEADNWNDDFGAGYFAGGIASELEAVGDNDDNFRFIGDEGVYTITVSLVDQTVTMAAGEAYPEALFIVGDDQSWSFSNELEEVEAGVFEGSATFSNGSTFRFFQEADNWDDDYSFAWFTGDISDDLEAAGDADDNFKFTGTTGSYKIRVSLVDKSITLEAYPESLYLVGDDQSWTFTDELTSTGAGVYEGSATFTNGSTFRFFEEVDNWNDDYTAGYFTGAVSSDLEAAGDGDDNFRFIGTDGIYNVTVDLINRSLELAQ